MKRKEKQNVQKGKFSFGDVLIIILSLAAMAGLLFIIRTAKEQERLKQEELSNISGEIASGALNEVSSALTNLVINEVNKEGWIELYNAGMEDIELKGLKVCIDNKVCYALNDSFVLERKGLYICELEQTLVEGTIIALKDENDEYVAHMLVPELRADESYATVDDGGIAYAYMSATKGTGNAEGSLNENRKQLFSVKGGFYDESFELSLNAPDDYVIYYTVDGTEPTTESEVYAAPLVISNRSGSNFTYAKRETTGYYAPTSLHIGTVVRVALADKSGRIVERYAETYFVGLANSNDYRNMPIVSMTVNPADFFDYFEGIYVAGRSYEDAVARGESTANVGNYQNGWVKEAYIEYFEPDKDKTYEGKVNVQIAHDYSIASGQKSFYFEGEAAVTGSGLSGYFGKSGRGFLLQTAGRDNNYKLREFAAAELLSGLAAGNAGVAPCILFVNGEYWGGYLLRQAYDADYFASTYHTGEEEVLTIENGTISNYDYVNLYQEFYRFVIENDMSDPNYYKEVKSRMDVQSYLDYLCANMYLANADYGSDVTLWRTITDAGTGYCDGKWRWLFGRLDVSMANGATGNVATASMDTFLRPAVTGDAFLQSLLMNEEFKNQLQETMTRLVRETFSAESTNAALDKVAKNLEKYAMSSYKRFMGNAAADFYQNEVKKIKKFFEEREDYILLYTAEVVAQGGNTEVIEALRNAFEEADREAAEKEAEREEAENNEEGTETGGDDTES